MNALNLKINLGKTVILSLLCLQSMNMVLLLAYSDLLLKLSVPSYIYIYIYNMMCVLNDKIQSFIASISVDN